MKYQIYLSKDVSDFINFASEAEGQKPATTIKNIVEDIVRITMATKEATENAILKGNKK